MKQSCARLLLGCLLLFLPFAAIADESSDFVAAHDAYRDGDSVRFGHFASRLQHSILLPYIDYWRLNLNLQQASDADIDAFAANHTDSPLAARLQDDWLRQLARQQRWTDFLARYAQVQNPDIELQCDAWQGQLALQPASSQTQAVALWRSAKPVPASCNTVFGQLFAAHQLTPQDAWLHFRHALATMDIASAQTSFDWLPPPAPVAPRQLEQVQADPVAFLTGTHDLQHRADQELVRYAIERLARKDAQASADSWLTWQQHFDPPTRAQVWAVIATQAARQHLPQSLQWFALAAPQPLDDDQLGWEARAALLGGDWNTVNTSILAMSDAGRALPEWRYWLARSEHQLGHAQAANLIWLSLSHRFDFYGLLAQEELGSVASAPGINYTVSGEELDAVNQLPGIRRALLLHEFGLRLEALREWHFAIRNFSDQQLLAAAELARSHRWLDCAINTADRTRQLHNFSLRFLTPYRDVAGIYANQYGLDEAWVYGLIRQESRFVSVARSGAGASGLMQIMPSTAHWIAHRLGVRHFRVARLEQPDTSLHFGMYYLKQVLQRVGDSDLLATAAYNAGPNRALRWRPQQPVEGAIYAETIPFSETRDYVKKVFANAVFYDRQFNRDNITLKSMLGQIPSNVPACPGINNAGNCGTLP